ncbi:MAG: hypothetical protein M3Q48_14770 [Actinomycetota bacterium]|nr:hypothetical protein [Actinomycetota bacterium]
MDADQGRPAREGHEPGRQRLPPAPLGDPRQDALAAQQPGRVGHPATVRRSTSRRRSRNWLTAWMPIAVIATPWAPVPPPAYGGIELVVDRLVTGFQREGHECSRSAGTSRSAW